LKYFALPFIFFFSLFSLLSCTSTDYVNSGYIETSLSIPHNSYTIPAILTLPIDKEDSPVVIMVHGTGSCKDEEGNAYLMLAHDLAEKGIASIRFDFPGCGDSTESYQLYCNSEAVSHINEVAQYIVSIQEIDASRIGLLGRNEGGTDVLLAASNSDTFTSVATWTASLETIGSITTQEKVAAILHGFTPLHFDWRSSLPLSYKWIQEAENMDVLKSVQNIQAPLATFHGTLDTVTPYTDSEKITNASSNDTSSFFPIVGANHSFNLFSGDLTHFKDLERKTIEWFKETL
jgi:hypothetical protein